MNILILRLVNSLRSLLISEERLFTFVDTARVITKENAMNQCKLLRIRVVIILKAQDSVPV